MPIKLSAIQTGSSSLVLWLVAVTPGVVAAQQQPRAVTASLVADTTGIAAGTTFTVALKLDIPSGYYTYYRSPGDFGLPTKVAFSVPAGFQVGPARFPAPEIKHEDVAGKTSTIYAYRRSTMILAEVKPPETLADGESVPITAQVSYQYCQDSGLCFPPKPATLKLSLPVVASRAVARASGDAPAIENVRRALPEPGRHSKYAKVHAVLSQDRLRPGDRATLGVVVDVDDGHQLQPHRSAAPGLVPTELVLEGAAGIEPFGEPAFPESQPPKGAGFSDPVAGYRGRFVIRVPVAARESLVGTTIRLSGLLRYQASTLDGASFPARFASFELDVPVAAKGDKVTPAHLDTFGPTKSSNAKPATNSRRPN